jgi:hypothetical protein
MVSLGELHDSNLARTLINSPLFSAVIEVHESSLALGTNCVYNVLYELQQFTSSLSFNQIRTPKLFWSDGMDRVTISGETLVLATFRSGIQRLLADTRSLMDKLTGGRRFVIKPRDQFRDDLPNTTRGYSWLSNGPFTEFPHAFITHLIHGSQWEFAYLNDSGMLSWNIPAVHHVMDLLSQINGNLMTLNYIFSDNRATQLCDQTIRNGLQPRNLYFALNWMFWLTRRTKTSNLTGMDACIPTFIPPILSDMMIEYLAGGMREAEQVFANIVFSKETASLYHK